MGEKGGRETEIETGWETETIQERDKPWKRDPEERRDKRRCRDTEIRD